MEKRKLATIEKILDVQPIEGADSIEKVKVREWWCVAKKGEFKIDDTCVYFEIDSLLSSSNSAFEFLAKGTKERTQVVDGKEYKGYRLKTIRLRGQISQGLALPIATFAVPLIPGGMVYIGNDVSEALNVVKYEPPIPAKLAGSVKGLFPGFLVKTDEERIQNCSDVLEKHKGEVFYVTEKLDGSSCTYYKKDGEFGVCSRNLELKDTEGNTLWDLARMMELPKNLLDGFAIQGEVVGPGIQGNPLKLPKHLFFMFNVFDINKQEYLGLDGILEMTTILSVPHVPIIDKNFILDKTVEQLLEYSVGKSLMNPNAEREGVVIRPIKESREILNGVDSRFSFKVISNSYLLNNDE